MRKRIFRAGNYPQGNYTKEDISKIVESSKNDKLPVIFGHWSEYKVKTAIPSAGTFSDFAIEGDYITAEVNYNKIGETMVNNEAYTNFSIGFGENNKIHHLALLGAMPPAVKDLDNAIFSETIKEDIINLEFSEDLMAEEIKMETVVSDNINNKEEVKGMKIEEIIALLGEMTLEDKIKLVTSISESISEEERCSLRKTLNVTSEYSEDDKQEVVEPKKEFSESDIERIAEEKANEKVRVISERNKALSLVKEKVAPAYHSVFEYAIEIAVNDKNVKEFSEGVKERSIDNIINGLEKMSKFIDTKEFAVKADVKNKDINEEITKIAEETRKSFSKTK